MSEWGHVQRRNSLVFYLCYTRRGRQRQNIAQHILFVNCKTDYTATAQLFMSLDDYIFTTKPTSPDKK